MKDIIGEMYIKIVLIRGAMGEINKMGSVCLSLQNYVRNKPISNIEAFKNKICLG